MSTLAVSLVLVNAEKLQTMLGDGSFHHATYRNLGTLWEGLWIYRKAPGMARGFDVAGTFPKDSPELDKALELVRHTGVSVGSYGNG